MRQRTIRGVLALFALALVSATVARSQSRNLTEPLAGSVYNTWEIAQQVGSSKGKLIIVTMDQPNRRQTCRIKSFTLEKLVCSRAIGGPQAFLPQQVAALILPGDDGYKLRFVLGTDSASAAAIWGTIVLAATCPVCAVATGIVALGLFLAATAVYIGDDQPDSLLYLAPGQHLSRTLGYVKS